MFLMSTVIQQVTYMESYETAQFMIESKILYWFNEYELMTTLSQQYCQDSGLFEFSFSFLFVNVHFFVIY